MPMPELPLNINDPSHDAQRDGERQDEAFYASHRGPKRKDPRVPYSDRPSGAARYED